MTTLRFEERVAYTDSGKTFCRMCGLKEFIKAGGSLSHLRGLAPYRQDLVIEERTGFEAWTQQEADEAFGADGGLSCDSCGLVIVEPKPAEPPLSH